MKMTKICKDRTLRDILEDQKLIITRPLDGVSPDNIIMASNRLDKLTSRIEDLEKKIGTEIEYRKELEKQVHLLAKSLKKKIAWRTAHWTIETIK